MSRERAGKKRGFTLIEAIVTLTIVAILAAIAIPTGIQYLEKAKQTARDKAARSIFLAAQKSLATRTSSGEKLSLSTEKVNVESFIPQSAFPVAEQANKDNIYCLSLDRASANKENQELYKLLDKYLADRTLLENAILLEFNQKTGKVFAAFYSDEVSSIGYGKTGANTYNSNRRSKEDRKKGKVGYWGVDSTGTLDGDEENVKADIRLVDYDGSEDQGNNINSGHNYGLLTAECTLPSQEELDKIQSLTITLRGVGENAVETVRIPKDGTNSAGMTLETIGTRFDAKTALEQPFAVQSGNSVKYYCMYLEQRDDGKKILVWILDSQEKNKGLATNYPNLGTGTITADMELTGEGKSEKCEAKESVHTFFAAEEYDKDTSRMAYEIKSVRHLNNIRYIEEKKTAEQKQAVYVQTQDVLCRDYKDTKTKSSVIDWVPIGKQGKAGNNVEEEDYVWGKTHGFFGIYKGQKHKIYDLTISGSGKDESGSLYAMTGLFSCISAKASVSDLELAYTQEYWKLIGAEPEPFIQGSHRVGGIAGENWGSVSRCTVQGRISAARGEAKVGALVGKNMGGKKPEEGPGLVTQCIAAADVTAGASSLPGYGTEGALAGGIVGDNYGRITYCESGTASCYMNGRSQIMIEPYFGVNTDLSRTNIGSRQDYEEKTENDVYTISGAGGAGGIAGQVRASKFGVSPEIRYCVNAAKVVSGSGAAGGLSGRYYSEFGSLSASGVTPVIIRLSYNAGTVSGAQFAGGVVGTYKEGSPLVSQGEKAYNAIRSCYNTGAVRATGDGMAGGIIGKYGQFTEMHDCYNIGTVTSETKGNADGIFRDRHGDRKTACVNCASDKAKAPVGWTAGTMQGRQFLPADELKKHEFEGMSKGNDSGVGPVDYPYPYLTLDNIGEDSCGLGTNFHRTKY